MEPQMIGCYLLFENFHMTTYQNILRASAGELIINQKQSGSRVPAGSQYLVLYCLWA